jgi:Flp pilus assembly protein CpaB
MNQRYFLLSVVVAGGLFFGGLCCLGAAVEILRSVYILNPTDESVAVVVPTEDIKANTKILRPENQFARRMFPRKAVPEDAITDMAFLEGRVTTHPLKAGRILTSDDVGNHLKIIDDLPQGRRAVTITLPAGSWDPPPGTRVDLIHVESNLNIGTTRKLLVEDAIALAVGKLESQKPAEPGPVCVTLAVTPKDAEQIVWLTSKGTFVLVPHGEGDREKLKTPKLTE